jgi:hypothetical protein
MVAVAGVGGRGAGVAGATGLRNSWQHALCGGSQLWPAGLDLETPMAVSVRPKAHKAA